jgi:uncharacterized repeat protein (TIGR02543 family)
MYEEKNSQIKELDWKGIVLKVALGVALLILVITLLPLDRKDEGVELSVTFQNNMASFIDAGRTHFTSERLPQNVGERNKVSLGDLVAEGIVRELRTEDGEVCDLEESYAEVTRTPNNIELTINLICGEEEESQSVPLITTTRTRSTTTNTTSTTTRRTTTTIPPSNNQNNQGNQNNQNNQNNQGNQNNESRPFQYSFIFNTAGGSHIAPQYITAGDRARMPANPVRAGFVFAGWFHQDRQYNFGTPVNRNTVVTARWVPANNNINPPVPGTTTSRTTSTNFWSQPNTSSGSQIGTFIVRFDSNGGTTQFPSQAVFGNERAWNPGTPQRPNARFIGWYHNGIPFNFNTRINSNITLVARYLVTESITSEVLSVGWGAQTWSFSVTHQLRIPQSLNTAQHRNVRISNLSFNRSLSTSTDLFNYNRLWGTTFENYVTNGWEYSGQAANLANIRTATVVKTNTSIYDRRVTWNGSVQSQCRMSFSFRGVNNACMYGISYRVTWQYEIER